MQEYAGNIMAFCDEATSFKLAHATNKGLTLVYLHHIHDCPHKCGSSKARRSTALSIDIAVLVGGSKNACRQATNW